jgi:WD40 repeat protein
MNIFEITIQRKSKESWPIVVERSQPGVLLPLRHEGTFQLSQTDFEELQSLLGQPEEYGTFLGKKVFQGDVRDAFVHACGESPDGLRVLLFVEAEDIELKILRWERLCAPKDGQWDFLRLDQRLPFSMYIPASTDRRFPPIGKRDLRALILAASPENLGKYRLAPFDVEASVAGVREALGEIPCDVLAPIAEAIGPPTLDELCRQLTDRSKQYTLLHFIGHGKVLKDGDTALYWANADNQVEVVTGQKMIQRLRRLQGPRGLPHFAFLSTCESASPEAEGALGGLGQRLVRELGMPAVIAMTEKVTVTTALALGQRFYHQLRESGHVDLALDEATAGLSGRYDITVPALFSRLAGQPLFSDDLDRDLTPAEIRYGLEQLQTLLDERAPILQTEFDQHAKILQGTLGADTTALSPTVRQERDEALFAMSVLCQEVSDLSFNALALGQTPPNYESRCPFLGLYPFHAEDREFFFGRETLTSALQQRLAEHPFLAVLGPSGSGKSSVILAGLVPQLQAQQPNLKLAYLTPSQEPLSQLTMAQALVENQPAVFVVDQFEELFTLCAEEEQRQQFIEQLLTLSQQQRVVITMRADFWGECAPYESLKTEMEARQTLIGPMNTLELRGAMEQQAAKVGLRFEADLSNAILDDVKEEPGAMPLLQHGLQELWKRRHGRWLNTTEYREGIGGIKQAIAKTADDVYNQLSPAEQSQFQNIFIRLTRLDESAVQGEGGRDTRRRVGIEELVPAGGELSATKKLLKHLADARLVVTSVNTVTHREEVEVAHEALIRYWPRLANWLDENRTNLHLRETIRQAALTWQENQSQEDFLVHKGVRLEDTKVLARQTGFLNQLEAGYVKACVALAEAAEKAVSKRRKITFVSLTAGIIIAVILAGFAVFAMKQAQTSESNAIVSANKAKQSEKKALTRQLGSNAILTTELPDPYIGGIDRGLLMVAQAFQMEDNIETQSNLLRVLGAQSQIDFFLHEGRLITFNQNGKWIAVAGDNRIRIWEIEKQRFIGQPPELPSTVSIETITFSPDNKFLASGNSDGTVTLWNMKNFFGQPFKTFRHGKVKVRDIAFSPNGTTLLASTGDDGRIVLWDVITAQNVGELSHSGVVVASFSPDGKWLVSADSRGRQIKFWNVTSQQEEKSLSGDGWTTRDIAFSANGKYLAVALGAGQVRVWDLEMEIYSHHQVHQDDVFGVSFCPNDETVLASVSSDRTIKIRKWKEDETLSTLRGHSDIISSVVFGHDSCSQLASGSLDGTVIIWNRNNPGSIKKHLSQNGIDVAKGRYVAFNPKQKYLAITSGDKIRLWNTRTQEFFGQPMQGSKAVFSPVAFSPDGNLLASIDDKDVKFWNTNNQQLLPSALLHKKNVNNIAFSPDGKLLASASDDKTVILWNIKNRERIGHLQHDKSVRSVAFSPNGQFLATGSENALKLWNAETQEPIEYFLLEGSVEAVAFSPDGKWLAAAPSNARVVKLWKVESQTFSPLKESLKGHIGYVANVAFSPDSKRLASAGFDGTVRLWDVEKQVPIGQPLLMNKQAKIFSAIFIHDGKYLVSAGYIPRGHMPVDEPVILWDFDPQSWVEKACRKAGRNLTQTEWERYLPSKPYQKTCSQNTEY